MKYAPIKIIAVALIYFLVGKVSNQLSIPPNFASPVWPAAGFAFVAIMLGGYRMAIGVWLGSLMVSAFNVWETYHGLEFSAIGIGSLIGFGAAGQALLASWLARKKSSLTNISSIFRFLIIVGPVSCLLGAVIGITSLTAFGLMSWDQLPTNFFTWWVGDSMGVLVIAPIVPILLQKATDPHHTSHIVFFTPMILVLIATVSFFLWIRGVEKSRSQLSERSTATGLLQSIANRMDHSLDTLHALESYYNLQTDITSEQFNRLTQPWSDTAEIHTLEWAPRVLHSQRDRFEREADNPNTFSITEMGADGLVTAAVRDEYFPITLFGPTRNETVIGFDLLSEPIRAAAMRTACTRAEATATRSIHLVQDTGDSIGFLVFVPIFASSPPSQDPWQALQGFVLGAFKIEDMIHAATRNHQIHGTTFSIYERDESDQLQLLFFSDHDGLSSTDRQRGIDLKDNPNAYHTTYEFAGQTWYFSFLAQKNPIAAWGLWGVLISGFLFTGLTGAFLLLSLGRTTEIEITVEERTRALAEANQALEAEVHERTLTQAALIEAKEKAERATHIKSEFLATMSHEIRTPMNGIIGMNRLLLDMNLTEEQRENAETVQTSAESLLAIINDILDFSKMEAGKLELEHIVFSLRDAMDEAIDIVKPRIVQRGLDFQLDIEDRVPDLLKGDPGRLRQVLLNLITNALKFTETGSIRVMLSLEAGDKTRALIRFEVIDTGIGIPKSQQERLFRSFSQVDASTTRKYGGTGLGLAISANLTEIMGGDIGVESEENQGSRFWFTAMFQRAKEKRLKKRKLEAIPQFEDDAFRFLVVEDNMVNQKVAVRLLKKMNINANVVGNGLEAITAFKQIPYHLILMDCQMPEMDGYQATARIREMEQECGGHIPIVAMTANAMKGDREKCLNAGMDDYIAKPVKIEALARVVQNWLKNEEPSPAALDDSLY